MNYKFLLIIILLVFMFSCATKNQNVVPTKKEDNIKRVGCMRFTVPFYSTILENEAKMYRYDYMLAERNSHYLDSDFIIAIRHNDNSFNDSLESFVKIDQDNLKKQVKIVYEKEWEVKGFIDKKINHKALQFFYFYGKDKIYQRSVYFECAKIFYVISLSSKVENIISNAKFDEFWKSISID